MLNSRFPFVVLQRKRPVGPIVVPSCRSTELNALACGFAAGLMLFLALAF